MRILANYGYKNNGDSYSVTMETLGDCPKDQVDETVDELFRMAKCAIKRQIDLPVKDEPAIPEPKKHNGNGKHMIKDPSAPISVKQKQMIYRLAKEKGQWVDGVDEMSMGQASETIENLLAIAI